MIVEAPILLERRPQCLVQRPICEDLIDATGTVFSTCLGRSVRPWRQRATAGLRIDSDRPSESAELYRALSMSPTAEDGCRRLRAAGFEVDYVEDRDGRRLGHLCSDVAQTFRLR
jgi:hypothetical protein